MDTKKVEAPFQLSSTFVSEFSVNNNFLSYDERIPGDKKIDVSYSIPQEPITKDNMVAGILSLQILVHSKIDENSLQLKLVLNGCFTEGGTDPEEFKNHLRLNGCVALYSIARATVSSISSQLFSVGNIVLPMVNFIKFRELEKSNGNAAEQAEQPE